jgi:hypothetical protein
MTVVIAVENQVATDWKTSSTTERAVVVAIIAPFLDFYIPFARSGEQLCVMGKVEGFSDACNLERVSARESEVTFDNIKVGNGSAIFTDGAEGGIGFA